MSGMTTINNERPNIVRGSSCLIHPRGWISRSPTISASASSAGSASASLGGGSSIRLEDISGAADSLQVAREAWIALDLTAQPGHLDVDITHTSAELCRQRQLLARNGFPRLLRQAAEQSSFGGGQADRVAPTEQLAADEVKAATAKADFSAIG